MVPPGCVYLKEQSLRGVFYPAGSPSGFVLSGGTVPPGAFYPAGQSLRGAFNPAGQSLRLTSPINICRHTLSATLYRVLYYDKL